MEDGRVLEYLVKVGTTVAVGDPLFTVEADKVTLEIESPAAGLVVELIAEPDTELPVGAEILILEVAG